MYQARSIHVSVSFKDFSQSYADRDSRLISALILSLAVLSSKVCAFAVARALAHVKCLTLNDATFDGWFIVVLLTSLEVASKMRFTSSTRYRSLSDLSLVLS